MLVQDINDNGPLFSLSSDGLVPAHNKLAAHFDPHHATNNNFTLMATVNENEIGALVFYDESSMSSSRQMSEESVLLLSKQQQERQRQQLLDGQQHFVIFDSDLGSNASFEVVIGASKYAQPGVDKIVAKHLRFNPSGMQSSGSDGGFGARRMSSDASDSTLAQQQQQHKPSYDFSSSSLLAFNHEPFDFDTLNVEPEINPTTGVASKILRFNVSYYFFIKIRRVFLKYQKCSSLKSLIIKIGFSVFRVLID